MEAASGDIARAFAQNADRSAALGRVAGRAGVPGRQRKGPQETLTALGESRCCLCAQSVRSLIKSSTAFSSIGRGVVLLGSTQTMANPIGMLGYLARAAQAMLSKVLMLASSKCPFPSHDLSKPPSSISMIDVTH